MGRRVAKYVASAFVLCLILFACGPAVDTGSRKPTAPGFYRGWSINWWQGADPTTQIYLQETTQEFVDLLNRNMAAGTVVRGEIHFYQTLSDLVLALNATASAYQLAPRWVGGNNGAGWVHPLDGSIHVWAMPKLEGSVAFAHLLLHTAIGDWKHADSRWGQYSFDALLLSLSIAGRR